MSSRTRAWRARAGAALGTLTLAVVAVIVLVGPAQAAVTHVWPVCRQGTEDGWTFHTWSDHRPPNAVDINFRSGREDYKRIVVASAAGTLYAKKTYSGTGYGRTVTIKHPDGTFSFYAHLEWRTTLEKGAAIEKGRPIASIGDSGNQGSPHLHYEQRLTATGSLRKVSIGGNQIAYPANYLSFDPTVPCS